MRVEKIYCDICNREMTDNVSTQRVKNLVIEKDGVGKEFREICGNCSKTLLTTLESLEDRGLFKPV